MEYGNMPLDGGHLLLNSEEKESLIKSFLKVKSTLDQFLVQESSLIVINDFAYGLKVKTYKKSIL